ncbi:hypothetical protein VNI00_011393, partial [Paramarasmius palmivorus]
PCIEDDSLLYMIQVAERERQANRPIPAIVEHREVGEEHVEGANRGLVAGAILLLEFLVVFFLIKQMLFLEFVFRHGE